MAQGITHSWPSIPVVRSYFYQDGSPIPGYVVFAAAPGVLSDGTVVVPAEFSVRILDGQIATSLLAIQDADRGVLGWPYTVTEKFLGARPPFRIMVSGTDGTIDLATVAPVVTPVHLVSSRGPMGDVTPAATAALTGALIAQAAAEAAATRAEAGGGGDGGPVTGMTQVQADARYLQQTQLNTASGVAGLDVNAQFPTPNLSPLTIDLVTLFRNKLA